VSRQIVDSIKIIEAEKERKNCLVRCQNETTP
jgi:hypothetical protein